MKTLIKHLLESSSVFFDWLHFLFVLLFVKVDVFFHGVSFHDDYCCELEAGAGRAPSTCPEIPLPFSSKRAAVCFHPRRPACVCLLQARPQPARPHLASTHQPPELPGRWCPWGQSGYRWVQGIWILQVPSSLMGTALRCDLCRLQSSLN